MGDLVPYRSQKARSEATAFLGMVIFLASWAMTFASLFLAYGILRARATTWPPEDLPALPFWVPLLNTGVIALSSVAFQLALVFVRAGRVRLVGPSLAVSALLGTVFLSLQIGMWSQLHAAGLSVSGGPYASVFYALTCFHALHVAIGVGALLWLCLRALRGAYTTPRHLPIRLWALYWHFVGVVWVFMFVLVFWT
jgi:cytochrome c oxidase subunit 3